MKLTPHPTVDPPECQGLDDADLLEFIALRDEDRALGESACTAFYNRHISYLYNTLYKWAPQLGGEQGVQDLVLRTLERAFNAAGTFSKNAKDDKKTVRLKVRAWLNIIAENIFLSSIRGQREEPIDNIDTTHYGYYDTISQDLDSETDISPERQLLNHCLEMLPEKQRDALILSYQFYDETREHKRLTNREARDIAEFLQTTTVNLRQLRSRAERNLRKCIEAGGTSGGQ